jgi:hypothetical protein
MCNTVGTFTNTLGDIYEKTHFIKYVAALIFLMILLSMFACNTDNTEKTDTTAESLEESVAETDSPTSEEGDPSANTEPQPMLKSIPRQKQIQSMFNSHSASPVRTARDIPKLPTEP